MLRWTGVGVAHWFVMVAFVTLSSLVLEAYFESSPDSELPILGGWLPYGLITEYIGIWGCPASLVLMTIRLLNRPTRRSWSRFAGSTFWQPTTSSTRSWWC